MPCRHLSHGRETRRAPLAEMLSSHRRQEGMRSTCTVESVRATVYNRLKESALTSEWVLSSYAACSLMLPALVSSVLLSVIVAMT